MNKNEEFWKKISAYTQQFNSFIVKKANSRSKMELALDTLLLVNLHKAITP